MKLLWGLFLFLLASPVMAGSFTITDVATADCDMAKIYASGGGVLNYGVATGAGVGISYGSEIRTLLRFLTLSDSMKQVVTDSGAVTWDSAKVTFNTGISNAGDSVFVSVYKILPIRIWAEGAGNGDDTCGCDWNMANDTAHSDQCGSVDSASWGTAGCDNTTADRSGARETVGSHPDSVLIDGSYADKDWYISSATITDTLGQRPNGGGGLIFVPVAYGEGDGSQSTTGCRSDDYATASVRPELTVWYTKTAPPMPRRRLMLLKRGG